MNRPGARGYRQAYRVLDYATKRAGYEATRGAYKYAKSKFSKRKKKGQYKGRGKRPVQDRQARKDISALEKRVAKLKTLSETSLGHLIYRLRSTGRVLSTSNVATHTGITGNTVTTLETVLAQLRYYNPAVPGTLITASGVTAAFTHDFVFTRTFLKVTAVNNYQVPCICTIYVCVPKRDTSIAPTTAFTNGLTDAGAPTATSPLVYLTDSQQFQDIWRIHKSNKSVLQAGQHMSCVFTPGIYDYDPSLTDSQTDSYQPSNKGCAFVIRVEGVLGHDAVEDEQATIAAGVDFQLDRTFEVQYDAGVDLTWIHISDTSNTFTTANPLISSKPTADNQIYSLT